MMSMLLQLRARILAPALAGLLLASCAGVRREPYVVQEPGFLAPMEYQMKARAIAPRIYRVYDPRTFAIVRTDKVYTRVTARPVDNTKENYAPTFTRTMQTVEVAMERPQIPATKTTPEVPRVGITFEFEPSGELIYTTHTTGPDRMFQREEFAWWPSSRRLYGVGYKE